MIKCSRGLRYLIWLLSGHLSQSCVCVCPTANKPGAREQHVCLAERHIGVAASGANQLHRRRRPNGKEARGRAGGEVSALNGRIAPYPIHIDAFYVLADYGLLPHGRHLACGWGLLVHNDLDYYYSYYYSCVPALRQEYVHLRNRRPPCVHNHLYVHEFTHASI